MECIREDHLTQEICSLYDISFSDTERVHYVNIQRTIGRGGELLSFHDRGFVGFAFLYSSDGDTFLVYLAVDPKLRSKGYGSLMLECIRSEYQGRTVFLPMEPLDQSAEDIAVRRRRYDFYMRNGCTDPGITAISDGYPFSILFLQGSASKDDVDRLIGKYEDIHSGRAGNTDRWDGHPQ